MKRQKGNPTEWEGGELQDTAVPLWLRLGSWNLHVWTRLGLEPLRRKCCPLGRGVRSLAPFSPRTESSEKGCHPVVLVLLRECDEPGAGSVERSQKLESTAGLENGTSLFLLLLPLVALPLEHFTVKPTGELVGKGETAAR